MKRSFTFLMAAFALMVCMMMPQGMKGQTTYTFTSKSWAATPANWTSGQDGSQMTTDRGVQVTTTVSGANATSPVSFTDVKQVVVTYSTNANKGAGTIKIKVGSNAEQSFTVTKTGGTTDREATFDYSTVQSGNVKLTVECTTNSIYIKSVAIKTMVKAPTFSPEAGTYSTTQNVTLSCATSGATIYYTTDGSSPTTSSSVYSSPISVSSTTTIKAFAVKSGMTNSTMSTATYTIDSSTQYTITFNPGSGTCSTTTLSGSAGSSITLPTASPSSACADAGWSFVGWATSSVNETNTAPTLLTGSYTIHGNATLFAVYRCNSGSATASAPMDFSSGLYNSTYGTITWTMSGVMSIKQEQNGSGNSAPNSSYVSSPRWYSGNKITITPSTRITSISVTANTEGYASALANSTYTNASATSSGTTATITPTNGNYTVTIVMGGQCRLSSLTVYYTYNVYSYATSPNCLEQVATPTFSPAAGTYTSAQNVSISCSTSGATIHYTTNGSTPTESSPAYSGAIAVSSTTTIKAIAVKSGMSNSAVASATYTISIPCTITLDAGNGTCNTSTMSGVSGNSITLPSATPSAECAAMGWTFAGWAESNVNETTTAPTLYTGSYTPTSSTTLYAVYKLSEGNNGSFEYVFADQGYDNAEVVYSDVMDATSGIGWAATDGTTAPTYYDTGEGLRVYNGGTFSVTTNNNTIVAVSLTFSTGSYTFNSGETNPVTWSGSQSTDITWNVTRTCRLQKVNVTYDSRVTTYATTPDCREQVATPTFSPAAGEYSQAQNVSISCGTTGATIYYTTDGSTPTTGSSVYGSAITVSETTTIKAMAVKTDLINSAVATATYTIVSSISLDESSFSFPYTGGNDTFDYTITNPVSGAVVNVTSSSWITATVSGNTVNFQVAVNNGESRSGEITLAYSKNDNTLATATVAVNQDCNPVLPGGADNPYTVAQALEIISDYADNQTSAGEVYVTGIVSQIDEIEVVQYHNAKYYISDDGTTNDQLMSYYGRYINNTDFMSEDELMMGDSVVIKGRLKKYVKNNSNNTTTTTPELDRGNYIVSLYRAVQPVTFNPGSCVTPESIWVNLFTESLFDWEAQIYYTTNGADPITSGTAFEDAWAADLELTQTTTLKAAAYVPELNKWSAVTEATYTIVPAGSGGWQGQPYTVSEALAALDQNSDIKGAYVHGIVSRIIQIDTTRYYNATYYISDDGEENNELYVFRGKYISRSDFTSTDQLKPGDEVTVYGDLSIYHETTKEFKAKNYIEDWYRPASIIITPEHFDFSSNATSGLIHVTYSNDIQVYTHNPEVQFCDATGAAATYDWLTVTPSEANDWDLEYIIEANEGSVPRTAYLKVSGQDSQSNVIVSNIISITQSEYKVDFAELPFSFSGGHGDIDDTPGLTGEHLGTYAAENTRLKFANPSNQMSTLVLKINETPGKLTYRIKGNGMQGGTFKVQQSSNGITYTDLASYTDLANDTLWVSIDTLRPSTRYIRWIFVTRNKGNVGVGSIHLYKPANSPCTYAFSVNGAVGEQQSSTVGEVVTMPVGSNITFNGQVFAFRGWTTNPNNVSNLLTNGASHTLSRDVTFYAVYNQQAAGDEADKHYAKVTREPVDWSGDYLIVYEEEGLAFNGGLDPLDVTGNVIQVMISDGVITATQALAAAKFTIAPFEDGYSIKSASGYYIGKNADSNGMDANESTEYKNIISYNEDEGEIDIIGLDGARLRYNPTSNQNRFRYYKASTYTGQEGIQLYRYVGGVDNLFTRIFINVTADEITIEGPSIIPNGSVLNVANLTNNLGADRLFIDEGGQLVTSSNVNAMMKKSITPYQDVYDNYYLVASPVNNLDPTSAGMTGTNFDLYAFDQSAQGAEWRNYEAGSFATLETGKGYLYANDYGGDINMGGTMTATANAVTIANVSGKPFAGWNLIGNPYPCNVTIGRPFYRLASGGAALATEATDRSVAIAPMEGVFVCADGTETVSFTKAPTTSTTSGRNLLSMRVSRSRGSKDERIDADNAIVRFGEGDQLRKLVLNPDLTQLYVAQDGRDYAIVNAEAEGEMPVSFRPAENGSYIFSVAAEGVTMRYLHLIDHKTGADVDLLKTPSYTFEANTGDYEGRFKLVFACGDTNDGSETFAYYNGSQWVVSNEGEATLQVVDMMGRVLSSQSIKGNAEVNVDRAAGVYLLRLMSGDDVKVQKIVIQ